jgi:hypothetical protein
MLPELFYGGLTLSIFHTSYHSRPFHASESQDDEGQTVAQSINELPSIIIGKCRKKARVQNEIVYSHLQQLSLRFHSNTPGNSLNIPAKWVFHPAEKGLSPANAEMYLYPTLKGMWTGWIVFFAKS